MASIEAVKSNFLIQNGKDKRYSNMYQGQALCGIFENNDRALFLLLIQKLPNGIPKTQLILKASLNVKPNSPKEPPNTNHKHPKIWHLFEFLNFLQFLKL